MKARTMQKKLRDRKRLANPTLRSSSSGWNRPGVFLLTVAMLAGTPLAAQHPPIASAIVGSQFVYRARKGDSLTLIGARFGMDARALAEANGLSDTARLQIGQILQIDNRHLVPQSLQDGILINIPQRMLFFFRNGEWVRSYPAAVGRASWPTQEGEFRVLGKESHKTWNVPESIQEEMRREHKPVKEKVPPGPENPLGERWIRISPECGIHGTNAPPSIYTFSTHGCIRLQPEAIAELYPLVRVGMPVRIIYEPVLLGRIGDSTYLEVHPDIYRRGTPTLESLRAWAASSGLAGTLDWPLAQSTLRARQGIARVVGR
jgi:L,D-transpeptidase ErfK/SrfK